MTVKNGVGYSESTIDKQEDFIKIMRMLCTIWKGMIRRNVTDRVYYYDLNGGFGFDLDNPIIGSPIIAAKALRESKLKHMGYVCEADDQNVRSLSEAMMAYEDTFMIISGNNESALKPFLPSYGYSNYGLIYADPTGYPSSEFNFMRYVSKLNSCDRIDLLLSFGSTTIKRVSNCFPDKYWRLNEHVNSIYRKVWLIREPLPSSGKKKWSFLLGTNWGNFPAPQNSFHRIDSEMGQKIFRELSVPSNEIAQLSMF